MKTIRIHQPGEAPGECFYEMDRHAERKADAMKLRVLADWFDKYDDERGYDGERDVQADLRRIANDIASRRNP